MVVLRFRFDRQSLVVVVVRWRQCVVAAGRGRCAVAAVASCLKPVSGRGAVVVVGVVAGSVVIGVGSGGNGFDITLAIISVSPASESL